MSQVLFNKTDAVRRRALTFVWIRAYCLTGASIIAAILLAIGTDCFFRKEIPALRWGYWFVILFAAAAAIGKWLWPAIRFRLSDVDVAKRIEQAIGDSSDQIATSIQLAGSGPNRAATEAHTAFEKSVMRQAEAKVQSLRISEVVRSRGIKLPLTLLAITAATCGIGLSANSTAIKHGLERLSKPWATLQWPRQNKLTFDEIPSWISEGSDLTIRVRDENAILKNGVFAELRLGSKRRRLELSTDPMTPSVFFATIKNVSEDIRVRVGGGDDRTEWKEIRVWRTPQLVDWQVQVLPPPSLGRPPTNSIGPIKTWANSQLKTTGLVDVPSALRVRTAELVVVGSEQRSRFPLVIGAETNRIETVSDELPTLTVDGEYWVEFQLESTNGETLPSRRSESQRWPVEVFQDQPPRLKLTCDDTQVGSKSLILLLVSAQDEVGIASAPMTLSVDNKVLSESDIKSMLTQQNESNWIVQIPIDLAKFSVAPDQLLTVRMTATDVANQQSEPIDLKLPVVDKTTLLDLLDRKTGRLAERLFESSRRQDELARETQQLLKSPPPDLETRLIEIFQQQTRLRRQLGNPTRGTFHLNGMLVDFLDRHQLDPTQVDNRRQTLSLQNEALGFASRIEIVANSLVDQPADTNRLTEFAQLQVELNRRIKMAAELLRTAATLSRLKQQAKQVQRRQETIRDSIQSLLQSQSGRTPNDLSRATSAIAGQHRQLRQDAERLYSELEFASQQSELDKPVEPRLLDALRVIQSSELISELVKVDQSLDSKLLGKALRLSAEITKSLQNLLDALDPERKVNLLAEDKAAQWVENINQVIEELQQLETTLRDRAAESTEIGDDERRQLDDRKRSIADKLDRLQQSIGESNNRELADGIDQAKTKIASTSGSNAANLNSEADDVQSAIGNLQQAAVKAASSEQDAGSVDLRATLRLLSQLNTAQSTIEKWTKRQIEANDEIDEPQWQQFLSLQQTVSEGFRLAELQLSSFQTANLFSIPLSQTLELATERLQSKIVDEPTRSAQQRVIKLLEQLMEAIAIQLEQKPNPPQTQEDQQQQQPDENQPNGISSFDLTLLYVMQKAINDETRQLAVAVNSVKTESAIQKRTRLDLAARQQQISATIEKLLDQTEKVIPDLPDF